MYSFQNNEFNLERDDLKFKCQSRLQNAKFRHSVQQ